VTAVRLRVLAALAVAVGIVGWLVLDTWERTGHTALPMPWTAVAGQVVLAGVVLATGLDVRRRVAVRAGRALDPLRAARIAVLATAAAYTGAVLAGWYAGLAASIAPDLVGERRSRLVLALAASVAAALLSGAGVLAQRWCRVPPKEDDRG
jgi:Protein of unknown function (DUF3180)